MFAAGTVFLEVTTSFDGMQTAVRREATKAARNSAKGVQQELNRVEEGAEQTGTRAGRKYGSAFEREVKSRVGKMRESIADVSGGNGIRASVAEIKKDLATLDRMNMKGVANQVEANQRLLGVHENVNRILLRNAEGSQRISDRTAANLGALSRLLGDTRKEMAKWEATDPQTGNSAAAEQARRSEVLQRAGMRQVAAAREMNTEIDKRAAKEQALGRQMLMAERGMAQEFGNRAEAQQRLGALQERAAREMEADFQRRGQAHLKAIADREAATRRSYQEETSARRMMEREFNQRGDAIMGDRNDGISRRLDAVAADAKRDGRLRIGIDIDEADAIHQVRRTRVEMEAVLADAIEMGVDVDQLAAARQARAAMQSAEDAIEGQVLRIRAEVERAHALEQAYALRSEIARIGDEIRFDPDLNTATVRARIEQLKQALRSIGGSTNVNGDILRLEALERQLSRVDRQAGRTGRALSGFNTGGAANATRVFSGALLAVVAVGPLLIPVLGVISAGILGVGVAALSAVTGVGVLIAALSGIGGAVKAMSELQKAKRTAPGGAGSRAEDQRQAISDARSLADAQKALSRVQTSAGDAMLAAGEKITDAENAIAKAQKSALAAQLAVNEARAQAVRDLEDLNNQLASARLQEQASAFSVEEAGVHLNVVLEDDQATDREKAVAQLAYDQAIQSQKEQSLSLKRLEVDAAAANATGAEGSERVVAAKDRVVDANEAIIGAERALTEAREDFTATQVDQAERVADAQLALSRVIEDQRLRADAAASGVDSLASATTALNEAMRNLSPAGQAFATFLYGLSPLLREIRFAAQEGLLPGLQEAMQTIVSQYGPGFVTFVGTMASAMGDLAIAAAEALTGPFWTQFFDFMAVQSPVFLGLLSQILGNLATFTAGVSQAFAPLATDIMTTLAAATEGIANWAIGLKDSEGFVTFIDYLVYSAPLVGKLFDNIFTIIGKLIEGLAPYADDLLNVFIAITGWIAGMDPATLGNIAIGFIAIVGAIQLLAGLVSLVAGVVTLLSLGSTALIVVAIVAAVTLLGGAIAYLWATSEGFRDGVTAVWETVRDAFLGPIGLIAAALMGLPVLFIYLLTTSQTFRDGLVSVVTAVGNAFVRLYEDWVKPVIDGLISYVTMLGAVFALTWTVIDTLFIQPMISWITWLWENVVEPIFGLIVDLINAIVIPAFVGLWEHGIKPVFDFIAAIFGTVWAIISTIFNAIYQIITFVVAPAFTWLWENAIKPVLNWIGSKFSDTWDTYIKPVFDKLSNYINDTVAPLFEAAVTGLGAIWDGLLDLMRTPIRMAIDYVINKGLIGTFNWLADKIPGMTKLDLVKIPDALQPGGVAPGSYADGGIIPGYSPGRDNHHFVSDTGLRLDLAGGEPVLRPEVGRVLGAGWVNGVNKAARGGGASGVRSFLGGFASGGILGKMKAGTAGGIGDIADALGDAWDGAYSAIKGVGATVSDFLSDPAAMLRKVVIDAASGLGLTGPVGEAAVGTALAPIDALTASIRGLLGDDATAGSLIPITSTSTSAGKGVGMGYQAQLAAILGAFPGIGITSTYRPGAVTAVGTKSYHGQGRAIDIAPRWDAFNWLADNYPNSRELIFTPAANRQIQNGKQFNGWAPVTKAMHQNHIHWAMAGGGIVPSLYDTGGDLPPGLSMIANKTGEVEHVLTKAMLGDIHAAIERNAAGSSTGYTFTGDLGPTAEAIAAEVERLRLRRQAAYGLREMGVMVQ